MSLFTLARRAAVGGPHAPASVSDAVARKPWAKCQGLVGRLCLYSCRTQVTSTLVSIVMLRLNCSEGLSTCGHAWQYRRHTLGLASLVSLSITEGDHAVEIASAMHLRHIVKACRCLVHTPSGSSERVCSMCMARLAEMDGSTPHVMCRAHTVVTMHMASAAVCAC